MYEYKVNKVIKIIDGDTTNINIDSLDYFKWKNIV
jgi:hypothetical protein